MGGPSSGPEMAGRRTLIGMLLAVGCITLCILLSSTGDGARQRRVELDQTLENFLGGGYKLKADDLDSQLERYRVMRNVALSAMKKQSLTAVPTETVTDEVKHLKQLKAKALKHLDSMTTSRGRYVDDFGMAHQGDDKTFSGNRMGGDGVGPTSSGSSGGGCSEEDANLGLCEDDSRDEPSSDLKTKEDEVSDNLRKEEQHGDAVRKQQMQEVDKERLKKAEGLLHRLTKDNSLINELVHHTVKVAGMAPATWSG